MVPRVKREAGRLDPQKPFFTIYHCNISRYDRRGAKIHNHLRSALGLAPDEYCNGFGFFGHGHRSNADWHFFWDRDAAFPAIECASLAYWKERGGEGDKSLFAQGFGDGTAEGGGQKMIHALLIKDYDDMINKIDKIKNAVSEQDNPVNPVKTETGLRIKIPRADGNPLARVYGYNVVIVGEGDAKVKKSVYENGYSYGDGCEPDGGVTTLEIPASELPAGKNLTIAVRPCSCLASRGRPLVATYSTMSNTLKTQKS